MPLLHVQHVDRDRFKVLREHLRALHVHLDSILYPLPQLKQHVRHVHQVHSPILQEQLNAFLVILVHSHQYRVNHHAHYAHLVELLQSWDSSHALHVMQVPILL